jgi:2-iminobutanoate/2-iminopropanoate deaminase
MAVPVGPYSPAVRAGPWLVCSGQVGVTQGPDGPVLAGGFEAQARRAIANVAEVLGGHGLSWQHVVKTTVFLTDVGQFPGFNELYMDALGSHRPARSLVVVAALPLGAEVEIEAWAYAER